MSLDSEAALRAIGDALPTLSPTSRAVAEYVLEQPDQAAFLNAAELAQAAGVSHASVIRFAQALGFRGYPELQRALQDRLSRKLTTVERLEGLDSGEHRNLWARQMKADLANLQASIQELDLEACEKAAALLAGARRVYALGMRSTASLAAMAAFALRAVRPQGHVVILSSTEYFEQLAGADERDVLLSFSFPRYFLQTLEITDYARSRGVNCVAVTDSLASPLAQLAHVSLTCRVAMNSFIESFVVPLSLLNTLVTAVALMDKQATVARLADLEKVWEQHNIYYAKERRVKNGNDDSGN